MDVTSGSTTSESVPEETLKRDFNLLSTFSFAFAFISPIVALYGIFAISVSAAGPAFWWSFPVVFVGQLLIAVAFAELVSRWPGEGSVYQWTHRLLGTAAGWCAGWVYVFTLIVAMATVAIGAAGFVAKAIGITVTPLQQALIALVILVGGTAVNLAGNRALKVVMTCSIIAETLGTVGLGTLLLFHTHHGLSILDHTVTGRISTHYLTGPFLLAMSFLGFSFVGFESAGSIAEEVRDPRRNVPKAVILSIVVVGAIVAYAGLALILALPNLGSVVAGKVSDPVYSTLSTELGSVIAKFAEILFAVAFLASFLALQTSASRILYTFGRDRGLPQSGRLTKLTEGQKQPAVALLLATAVGALMILASQQAANFYQLMVNFSAAGFFVAYLFPLAGSVICRFRKRWEPSVFNLGRAGNAIAVIALAWCVLEFVNIAWPRSVYAHWYLNWSVWLAVGGLAVIGIPLFLACRARMQPLRAFDDKVDLDLDEPVDQPVKR